jgi:hypothetical protein
MNETTFENCRVGDIVWSITQGRGKIVNIQDICSDFPICVLFDNGNSLTYTLGGLWQSTELQSLFWDEVKITAPPKPKRMVKKVVEGWVNIYTKKYRNGCFCGDIYPSQESAIEGAANDSIGKPLFIYYEYEVEEQ